MGEDLIETVARTMHETARAYREAGVSGLSKIRLAWEELPPAHVDCYRHVAAAVLAVLQIDRVEPDVVTHGGR